MPVSLPAAFLQRLAMILWAVSHMGDLGYYSRGVEVPITRSRVFSLPLA